MEDDAKFLQDFRMPRFKVNHLLKMPEKALVKNTAFRVAFTPKESGFMIQ